MWRIQIVVIQWISVFLNMAVRLREYRLSKSVNQLLRASLNVVEPSERFLWNNTPFIKNRFGFEGFKRNICSYCSVILVEKFCQKYSLLNNSKTLWPCKPFRTRQIKLFIFSFCEGN